MKRLLLITLAIALSATVSLGQWDKSSQAIQKVMTDQTAAWNRGDLTAFMEIGYWKSDSLKFISGDRITHGWQQTLDNYKKSYSDRAKMGTLTFSDLDITIFSKDVAFVVGSWKLQREKDAPGGKFTLLFRKFKEGWRIVVDHTS